MWLENIKNSLYTKQQEFFSSDEIYVGNAYLKAYNTICSMDESVFERHYNSDTLYLLQDIGFEISNFIQKISREEAIIVNTLDEICFESKKAYLVKNSLSYKELMKRIMHLGATITHQEAYYFVTLP